MAFAAELNTVPLISWYLFATTIIWIIIYDTQYAMVDREDDKQLPIHSTALWFGKADRLIIGLLQIILIILWGVLGCWLTLNKIYYLFLFIIALLFIYQQWLMKDRNPTQCFKAFLNNNWVGLVLWVGVIFSLREYH